VTGRGAVRTADRDDLKADLHHHTGRIKGEVLSLKDLAHAFERWHQDMNLLVEQNRAMRANREELHSIVQHLTMVSLNAKIEAARAGESARGFAVVATEVRSLANRAEALSKDFGTGLHRNDLATTATFQDIQASGKMMMAAISGLESMIGQLRSKLD
jgi:hypothetical protein